MSLFYGVKQQPMLELWYSSRDGYFMPHPPINYPSQMARIVIFFVHGLLFHVLPVRGVTFAKKRAASFGYRFGRGHTLVDLGLYPSNV